jgi:protein SCO1/2
VKRTYLYLASGLTVILLGVLAYMVLFDQRGVRYASCEGRGVAGAEIGGPFTLVDESGATVTEADILDGPALIYFGYTNCPDVCPVDSARNAAAVEILDERGIDVTPVLVTVDPERDTPEVLTAFTDIFHKRMIGLTGTREQVKAAADAYKVYENSNRPEMPEVTMPEVTVTAEMPQADDHAGMEMSEGGMAQADAAEGAGNTTSAHAGHEMSEMPDYLVDHSSFTYLMLPDQGLADFFSREVSSVELAERVECAVDE